MPDMPACATDSVQVARDGVIATVTLNRPDRMNTEVYRIGVTAFLDKKAPRFTGR
jgi:predicted lipoprotein